MPYNVYVKDTPNKRIQYRLTIWFPEVSIDSHTLDLNYANCVQKNMGRTELSRHIFGHIPSQVWHLKNLGGIKWKMLQGWSTVNSIAFKPNSEVSYKINIY